MAGYYGETSHHHLSNVTFSKSQLEAISKPFEELLRRQRKEFDKMFDRLERRMNERSNKNARKIRPLVDASEMAALFEKLERLEKVTIKDGATIKEENEDRGEMLENEYVINEISNSQASEINDNVDEAADQETPAIVEDINEISNMEVLVDDKYSLVPSTITEQPTWRYPQEVMEDKSKEESFSVYQTSRNEDEYEQAVFDPGVWEWMNMRKEMFLPNSTKAEYEKIVFDPGGIVLL